MKPEPFRWLAGVIAAHPNRKVYGRTRLQKTMKLLQRKGFPTDYQFTIHFYGPYSEGVNSDVKLLRDLNLVAEELRGTDTPYYVYTASAEAELPEIAQYSPLIRMLEKAADVPLELAATYDAYREIGCNHSEALTRLRHKKGAKCANGNEENALALLKQLGLPNDISFDTPA